MKIKYTLFAIIAFTVISCNKFLDKATSKTSAIQPSTIEQLESILNNYSTFYAEADNVSIFASDDYDLNVDTYKEKNTVYSIHMPKFALWDTKSIQEYDRHYWPNEWKKIFTANMVLTSLNKVSGGTSEQRAAIKSECHFIIAYSYLRLATAYCLPYTENTKDEMGLPIKTTVGFDEDLTRISLAKTYEFIEANLNEGLKLTNKMTFVNGKNRSWRASKGAVNAFAARYWLIIGDYNKSLNHANIALGEHSSLMDYNIDMRYSSIKSEVDVNGVKVEIKYPYTHDNQIDPTDMMEWKEFYYFRVLNYGSWWYMPSKSLLDCYDKANDLRYKYHIVENYSYARSVLTKEIPGYIFFFRDRIPNGPTVAEMLLTKAECQARLGDFTEAMSTVNILRAVRISRDAPTNVINLVATSQEDAVKTVLKERRREMPFTSRWSDIRRLNHNSDTFDDVVLSKTFFPYNISTIVDSEEPINYVLDNYSRKYASPIPLVDIDATLGVMKQNIY